MPPLQPIEQILNTIRFLAVDAVEKAKSGHPGTPMGSAEIAYVLWTKQMRYNPKNPNWLNRDRFVLSAGHASMLLYSMLYLTGYDLTLDDIKQFRQLGSRTPGHPEHEITPGVETTTGPLGQGFAAGVGMAIAERYLRSYLNRPEHNIIDYYIYALCSDGDMMEGVSSEAASLAGHLKLNKLIYIYSDNRITIEGSTGLAFTEDVSARFRSYGWFVQDIDGQNIDEIDAAITAAKEQGERPSLIHARAHIGFGSPHKQDTAEAHGEPLGANEVIATKENLGWPTEPTFIVPDNVLLQMRKMSDIGQKLESAWQEEFDKWADAYPDLASKLASGMEGRCPKGWESRIPAIGKPGEEVSTRDASGKVMNAIAPDLPFFIGGSGDLAPSTKTNLDAFGDFTATDSGPNIHFGVREHAMGAALNGMALTKPIIPFGATFLVFSDYMRPAIRIGAIMRIPVKYVFTHDSIFLGEDGPTHQPIEHLASLRAMPNLVVIRPADATETCAAWEVALDYAGPVALVLTRQKLPVLDRSIYPSAMFLEQGAYTLWQVREGNPDIILIATGSEVHPTLEAARILGESGTNARVVSMPSWELFEKQTAEYKESVLPSCILARLAVEAASTFGWHKWVGTYGDVVGMTRFGASAPYKDLQKFFGFTPDNIAAKAREVIERLSAVKGGSSCG